MASSVSSPSMSFFQLNEVNDPDAMRINLKDFSVEQRNLFDLILNENAEGVKLFFTRRPKFDINVESFTRALLSVTIDLNRDDILQLLMEKGARVGSALYTAVREGSVACVRVLLPYVRPELGDVGPEDVKPDGFLSPLMLASHLDDFDIMELMISEGYTVPEPQDSEDTESGQHGCIRVKCGLSKEVGLKPSQERSFLLRVNSYHAIANPLYIAYTYLVNTKALHPIFQVFEMNKKLKEQMSVDFEFRNNYKEYSKKCEKFAVDLLEHCRTVEEIKELTEVLPEIEASYSKQQKYIEVSSSDAKELTVLNLAIRNKHDELVAHPYSQLRLNMVIYHNIYSIFGFEAQQWRRRGFISRFLYGVRHTLLLPFIALLYIVAPDCGISNMMKNPVVKFYSHTGAFGLFIIALILSSFEDKLFESSLGQKSFIDYIILAFVLGLFIQEAKELYFQGAYRYAHQWWNILSLLMVILFLISFLLQFTSYLISGNLAVLDELANFTPTTSYEVSLLANSLFSLAMVLSFIHMSHVFQVNSTLGPIQLSMYKLILDVLRFLFLFFTLFIAFGFSLRKLYSHYITTQHLIAKMKNTGDMAQKTNITKLADVDHPFSGVGNGLFNLFWSVFGLTELSSFETKDKNFTITKETGQLLFGFFQVLIVIIAVNMLIAMMTRSYESIADNADMTWKVSRTRMWMNWVDKGSVLPPPFNLIPNIKNIVAACKYVYERTCGRLCKSNKRTPDYEYRANLNGDNNGEDIAEEEGHIGLKEMPPGSTEQAPKCESERRNAIKRIVERYLHQRKEDAKQEDSLNILQIKEMQEKMMMEMRKFMGLPPTSPRANRAIPLTQSQQEDVTEPLRERELLVTPL